MVGFLKESKDNYYIDLQQLFNNLDGSYSMIYGILLDNLGKPQQEAITDNEEKVQEYLGLH